jgi:hypothetical protein
VLQADWVCCKFLLDLKRVWSYQVQHLRCMVVEQQRSLVNHGFQHQRKKGICVFI